MHLLSPASYCNEKKFQAVIEEAVTTYVTRENGSPCPMYVVPAGMWHTTEALVSGTIIFESKDGKYGEE